MRISAIVVAMAALCLLVGCGSGGGSSQPPAAQPPAAQAQLSAEYVADKIRSSIPEITKVVPVTEDNDPNNLIGRPNGYVGGAIIFDSRVQCNAETEGTACGAFIEQWPDEAAAEKRAEYISGLQEAAPMLGTEYQTIGDGLLLRVDGDLKPSAATKYEEAFVAATR